MKTRRLYSPKRRPRFNRRTLATLFGLVFFIIIAILVFSRGNSPGSSSTDQTATTRTTSQKGGQNSSSSTAVSDKTPSSSSSTSGAAPQAPYGNLVSNHNASFNDTESSTCLTSAGAKCKISFSKDSVTKNLEEKTTNADGAAYWSWKPQDLGLTTGNWQISAAATMNGQTANASDSLKLTIQP